MKTGKVLMNKEQQVKAALESGIEPITMLYNPICSSDDGKPFALMSQLNLNSTFLGHLTPKQYEMVADRTIRSDRLAQWAIVYAARDYELLQNRLFDIRFVSVRLPVRAAKTAFVNSVEKLLEKNDFIKPERICLRFSVQLLFEQQEAVAEALVKLKDIGFKTMLTDFGDEFCPVMRITTLPFDYILLHPMVTAVLNSRTTNSRAHSLIEFVKANGFDVLLDAVNTDRIRDEASFTGSKGYITGSDYKSLDDIIGLLEEVERGETV